jgi:DNA-binding LytR/AlgR family response regulator
MSLKILIVDDEVAVALFLKTIIEQIPDTTVVAIADRGQQALRQFEIHQPQVVFLDIDMPGMNGLEVAHLLAKKNENIYFVFATAYPDYALQAFEIYSFDYILKPFNEERIKKTLRKIKKQMNPSSYALNKETTIIVEQGGQKIFLKPGEIHYIESRKPKVKIKTRDNAYIITGDLKTLEHELRKHGFFRSHRGYLVNLKQIKEIVPAGYTFQIILLSGDKVLLSRQQKVQLLEELKKTNNN